MDDRKPCVDTLLNDFAELAFDLLPLLILLLFFASGSHCRSLLNVLTLLETGCSRPYISTCEKGLSNALLLGLHFRAMVVELLDIRRLIRARKENELAS